jgi:hypothetical protein
VKPAQVDALSPNSPKVPWDGFDADGIDIERL